MKRQENRRNEIHIDYQIESDMGFRDLNKILKIERREENIKLIKELMFNKLFLKCIHAFAIFLSLLFAFLGILNS